MPTKASFENVFPHLRQPKKLGESGGIYIIEDWNWIHKKEYGDEFPVDYNLINLISLLLSVKASTVGIIQRIWIFNGFVAIERGFEDFPVDKAFRLEDWVYLPSKAKIVHPIQSL